MKYKISVLNRDLLKINFKTLNVEYENTMMPHYAFCLLLINMKILKVFQHGTLYEVYFKLSKECLLIEYILLKNNLC